MTGGETSYERLVAEERDQMDAFKKAHPKEALALELAGGLATGGAGGKLIAGAASTTGKVLRGGAIGMTTGGLSGAGHNEDPDKLATDVGMGAALGTLVGGAVPVATAGASKLLDKAMPSRKAANEIAAGVERDAQVAGTSYADELARVRAATAGPHDAIGAERALAGALGPEAQAAARTGMAGSSRQTGVIQRAADDINAARPGAPDYATLYAQPHVAGAEAQQLAALIASRPGLQGAGVRAERSVRDSGQAMAPAGQYSHAFLHHLDQQIADRISALHRSGNSKQAAIASGLQAELRGVLGNVSPNLMATKADYARGSQAARYVEGVLPSMSRVEPGISVGDAASLAGSVLRGNIGSAAAKVYSLMGGGVDERKAEAIANVLLTRYGDPERLSRVLAHLEGLAPVQRRGQLDALLAGGLTETLVGQRSPR